MHCARIMAGVCLLSAAAWAAGTISGRVVDTQGGIVPGARVKAGSIEVVADPEGRYRIAALADGVYELRGEAADLASEAIRVRIGGGDVQQDVKLTRIAAARQSIEVAERALEPQIDLRNAEVFERTLFTRDDQVLQQMNAGIDAGQHEGGGKSVEIRRFGFNLDHGGVNGGLKVMLDGVQQNQGTQGHGQGYLGSLKALSPELIEDVTITNGPFSAEYGDFSGLGVVHIHQRALGDQVTVRLAGGNFNTGRGFLA
jgi:outer membrane receptor protein involved in Fe transport